MATLIPAIGTCVSNMTGGERRFANRLEQKLEDDWLLLYEELLTTYVGIQPCATKQFDISLRHSKKSPEPDFPPTPRPTVTTQANPGDNFIFDRNMYIALIRAKKRYSQ